MAIELPIHGFSLQIIGDGLKDMNKNILSPLALLDVGGKIDADKVA